MESKGLPYAKLTGQVGVINDKIMVDAFRVDTNGISANWLARESTLTEPAQVEQIAESLHAKNVQNLRPNGKKSVLSGGDIRQSGERIGVTLWKVKV